MISRKDQPYSNHRKWTWWCLHNTDGKSDGHSHCLLIAKAQFLCHVDILECLSCPSQNSDFSSHVQITFSCTTWSRQSPLTKLLVFHHLSLSFHEQPHLIPLDVNLLSPGWVKVQLQVMSLFYALLAEAPPVLTSSIPLLQLYQLWSSSPISLWALSLYSGTSPTQP